MSIKENDVNLTNSPIYNMSMCSLENFHTCFLSWLGNNYKHEFLEILTGVHYIDKVEIKVETQVNYGKNNILDMLITVKNGDNTEYIVIENKLKSFPTEEQLSRYQEYFVGKNTRFILLSLAPKLVLPKPWNYLDYSDLAEKMKDKFSYKNDYDKYLIDDYINVVTQLVNAFPKTSSQKYDFYENNKLDEIGLKDIYVKWRTSEFANYIKQKLNRTEWDIGFSFHNKKGTIDIVKSFPKYGFNIGIQIENNQYRYFMNILWNDTSDNANKQREIIANQIAMNNYWFQNTMNPVKARTYENFCGYAPGFIYRYFYIDKYFGEYNLSKVSYESIFEQIEKDIKSLDENQHEIIRIVGQAMAR